MADPPLGQVGITLEKALQPEQILHHLPFTGPCPSPHQQTLQHWVYIATEAGDNLERQAQVAAGWPRSSVGRAQHSSPRPTAAVGCRVHWGGSAVTEGGSAITQAS